MSLLQRELQRRRLPQRLVLLRRSAPGDYYYWPRLLQDPNYKIQHWDRYWEMRRGIFATTTILNYIDGLASELVERQLHARDQQHGQPGAAAGKPGHAPLPQVAHPRLYCLAQSPRLRTRTKFWNGATLNPAAYASADGEVDAMKNFLMQRLAWIDDQIHRHRDLPAAQFQPVRG